MSEELKPCRWCDDDDVSICNQPFGCAVRCHTCGALGPTKATLREAADSWNTRPPPKASIPDAVNLEAIKEIAWGFKNIPAADFEAKFPWFLDWMTSLEAELGNFPWDKYHPAPEQLGFAYGVLFAHAQRIEARSDETLQAARPEGQEPDGEADAPTPNQEQSQ